MKNIYSEYGQYFYLPMTQAFSLAVPVTLGCSWDKCLYCDLNQGNRFRIFSMEEIEKAVLAGGNSFCLPTSNLIQIIGLIKEYFPQIKTISSFARADDILNKSDSELIELKRHGPLNERYFINRIS